HYSATSGAAGCTREKTISSRTEGSAGNPSSSRPGRASVNDPTTAPQPHSPTAHRRLSRPAPPRAPLQPAGALLQQHLCPGEPPGPTHHRGGGGGRSDPRNTGSRRQLDGGHKAARLRGAPHRPQIPCFPPGVPSLAPLAVLCGRRLTLSATRRRPPQTPRAAAAAIPAEGRCAADPERRPSPHLPPARRPASARLLVRRVSSSPAARPLRRGLAGRQPIAARESLAPPPFRHRPPLRGSDWPRELRRSGSALRSHGWIPAGGGFRSRDARKMAAPGDGADLEASLLSFEKLDRASPDLWPEQLPGVAEFAASFKSPITSSPPKWMAELENDDIDMLKELGSLTTANLMEKVRGLQNLAYQLGLDELPAETKE
uniref:Protein lin-52 homolog n=1 Tax=Phasianus colchicus TaxID=9054 RepID=A0A669Q7D0_PHACC